MELGPPLRSTPELSQYMRGENLPQEECENQASPDCLTTEKPGVNTAYQEGAIAFETTLMLITSHRKCFLTQKQV